MLLVHLRSVWNYYCSFMFQVLRGYNFASSRIWTLIPKMFSYATTAVKTFIYLQVTICLMDRYIINAFDHVITEITLSSNTNSLQETYFCSNDEPPRFKRCRLTS